MSAQTIPTGTAATADKMPENEPNHPRHTEVPGVVLSLEAEIDKGVIGRADDKGNGENKQGKVDAVADDLHG